VLSVILFHFYPKQFYSGFIGVDLFFVISGFLISQILYSQLAEGRFRFREFWLRRMLRLMPALLLVLSSSTMLTLLFFIPEEAKLFGHHLLGSLGFVQNLFLVWETSYFTPFANFRPLLHIWSLGVEEQFYLFWPIFFWLGFRMRAPILWSVSALAVLSGLSFLVFDNINTQFYLPVTRAWQFCFGAIGGVSAVCFSKGITRVQNSEFARAVVDASSIGLIGLSFYLSVGNRPLQPIYVLPAMVGLSLFLTFGSRGVLARLLSTRVIVWVGLVSYSLYLWHWPYAVFSEVFGLSDRWNPFLLVLIFATAATSYYFLERPMRYNWQSRLRNLKIVLIWGFCLILLGFLLIFSEGHFSRAGFLGVSSQNYDFGEKDVGTITDCSMISGLKIKEDWCDIDPDTLQNTNVAVLGDSFARFQTHTFRIFAERNPDLDLVVNGFSRGMCPPIPDYGPTHCRQFYDAISSRIKKMAEVHTVVMALRWEMYADHLFYSDYNILEKDAAFFRGLTRAVEDYRQMGKQVVFVLMTPTNVPPLPCMNRWGDFSSEGTCYYSQSPKSDAVKAFWARLNSFIEEASVPALDPMAQFCELTKGCLIQQDEKVYLVKDGIHMSWHGAEAIATAQQSWLRAVFESK